MFVLSVCGLVLVEQYLHKFHQWSSICIFSPINAIRYDILFWGFFISYFYFLVAMYASSLYANIRDKYTEIVVKWTVMKVAVTPKYKI